MRGERGLLRFLAEEAEQAVHLLDRLAAGRFYIGKRLLGLLWVPLQDAAGGAGLDAHDADVMGDDIVQLGTRAGRLLRWTFTDIRAESFRWQGHALGDDGKTWEPEVDIQFRRP